MSNFNPTQRKHNYFTKVYVSTTNFQDLRLCWNFVSLGIAISNEGASATDVVQYSFDGVYVAGDLTPFASSEGIIFDNRYEDRIYLRLAQPGPPVLMRLETWAGANV